MSANWGTRRPTAGQDVVIKGQHVDEDGEPIDITGWSLKVIMKTADGATSYTSTTFTLTDPTAGRWQTTCPYATNLAWGGLTMNAEIRATAPTHLVMSKGILEWQETIDE